jgi:signal transduction histidine kinase
MSRGGLRLRLALLAALVTLIALVVGAGLLLSVLRNRLDSAATSVALARAQDVAALASSGALPAQLAFPGENDALIQVVTADGTVVASTGNIAGEPSVSSQRPTRPDDVEVATTAQLPIGDGQRFRVVAIATDTPDHGPVVVYAGESLETADDATAAATTALTVGLPILVALVAALAWWTVTRALRPVKAISQTLAVITASDLHRRVPLGAGGDEISRLGGVINDTLERLDTAALQQRRFVADASHELRSPLASLRADLEVSLQHPDRSDWTITANDLLGDVERLQHLADDLLLLARLDATPIPRREPVDLAALAASEIDDRPAGGSATIRLAVVGDDHRVSGDHAQLARLVRNLLDNATRHATAAVVVTVSATAETVMVTVTDDGHGIPPEQRARVFERFVRLDDARSADGGGAGLGLAIVREVTHAHRGTIEIADTPAGTSFVLGLPRRANPIVDDTRLPRSRPSPDNRREVRDRP